MSRKLSKYYNKFKDKEWLIDQYVTLQKSFTKMCEEIDISENLLNKWLIEFNIPKRTSDKILRILYLDDIIELECYADNKWSFDISRLGSDIHDS